MVGRVPLCVHGAGETKTGSVSSPGAEEGWALFVQFLGGNHTQALCHLSHSCSQGAVLKARRPTGLEGWPQPVKPWIPQAQLGKEGKGFGEEKAPNNGAVLTPQSPFPQTPVPAHIPVCVSPHLQTGSLATLSKGILSFLASLLPQPLSLAAPQASVKMHCHDIDPEAMGLTN